MPNVGLNDIAELLRVTPRSITKWVKERGLPQVKRGLYDPKAVVHWKLDQHAQELERAREGSQSLSSMEMRRLQAQTESIEIDLAKKKAAVIAIPDAELAISEVTSATRTRLLSLPKRLQAEVPGTAEQKKVIGQRAAAIVDEALHELAGIPAKLFDLAGGAEELPPGDRPVVGAAPPAPKNKRKRVGRPAPRAVAGDVGGAGEVANQPG